MFLDKKIGIIGGGQLGKMMILEAKKFGLNITILDPTKNCPASSICDKHLIKDFNDKDALLELCSTCDIVTYEFEHIGYKYLLELEDMGYKIYPTPKALAIIQNKYIQKLKLKENNINIPIFEKIENIKDIEIAFDKYNSLILKTTTGGYDGKGNYIIKTRDDITKAYNTLNKNGDTELMIEELIDFDMEISVLACSNSNDIKVYPICKNIHNNSILHKTLVPANIPEKATNKAIAITTNIMKLFDTRGIFCVEFFVCKDGDILVNEIAPRPHNSGHYSIESVATSQFENHIRSILDLPLGSTKLLSPCVMINLLGDKNYTGNTVVYGTKMALSVPNTFLHIYGKEKTMPYRKMGHLTTLGDTLDIANKNSDNAFAKIKIIGTNKII